MKKKLGGVNDDKYTLLVFEKATEGFVQHGVLCKQGLTFKLRLFASLYFGSGLSVSRETKALAVVS
jgi:hypothetical protein